MTHRVFEGSGSVVGALAAHPMAEMIRVVCGGWRTFSRGCDGEVVVGFGAVKADRLENEIVQYRSKDVEGFLYEFLTLLCKRNRDFDSEYGNKSFTVKLFQT